MGDFWMCLIFFFSFFFYLDVANVLLHLFCLAYLLFIALSLKQTGWKISETIKLIIVGAINLLWVGNFITNHKRCLCTSCFHWRTSLFFFLSSSCSVEYVARYNLKVWIFFLFLHKISWPVSLFVKLWSLVIRCYCFL